PRLCAVSRIRRPPPWARAHCPCGGVTPSGVVYPRPRSAFPGRPRSYGLMRQTTSRPPALVVPRSVGLGRLLRAPAAPWSFPTFSLHSCPRVLGPLPRRLVWCPCPFLPPRTRPSPRADQGGAPHYPLQRLQAGRPLRGCSHALMCRPAGLLTTPVAPTDTASRMAAVVAPSEALVGRSLPQPWIC